MALYLVRHGRTEWNAAGRAQGWGDAPLLPEGRDLMRRTGATLRRILGPAPPTLIASSLPRAVESLRLIRTAAGWEAAERIDPDLREIGLGAWEGLTATERGTDGAGDDWFFHAPGGEDWDALVVRLDRALGCLPAEGDTVLVGHGVANMVIRGRLLGRDRVGILAAGFRRNAICRIAGASEEWLDVRDEL